MSECTQTDNNAKLANVVDDIKSCCTFIKTLIQVSVLTNGIKICGFRNVSAKSLLEISKKHSVVITVDGDTKEGISVTVKFSDPSSEKLDQFIIGSIVHEIKGKTVLTRKVANVRPIKLLELEVFMKSHSIIDALIFPTFISFISALQSDIIGSIGKCQKQKTLRRRPKLIGSFGTRQFRRQKFRQRVLYQF